METFKFFGLGTHWQILCDGKKISRPLQEYILNESNKFEKRFSRFIKESEVSRINILAPGTFKISQELLEILKFGIELSKKSVGYFDPSLANILEAYGYNQNLDFKERIPAKLGKVVSSVPGFVSLKGNKLTLGGSAKVDLGGWGKGYLIDKLYNLLLKEGYENFLIDGGGDLRGTIKKNGGGWRVGLEHPTDPECAIGVIELKNKSLANSGVCKRKAGSFHHIIDPRTAKPTRGVLASYVLADTATVADGLATALLISPAKIRNELKKEYAVEYLLIDDQMRSEISEFFPKYHLPLSP